MKNSILLTTVLCPIIMQAQVPPAYYSGTDGLSGFALKTRLHNIISHNTISWHYGDLPAFYQLTDRDLYYEADSSLLDIYAENPLGADPYNYSYDDPSQLISGATAEGVGWNREHLFSQSFFYSNYPMYSDLHFIVPTDARVNQRRSNLPFGQVDAPTFVSQNGSKVGPNSTPGYTLSVFEPIDEFKGDVARILFYVAVRYETLLPLFQTGNTRNPFEAREEVALRAWLLPLLKQWHEEDPVSQKETDRNQQIFQLQGNRNPFIDHPEWVDMIWHGATGANQVPDPPIYLNATATGAHFVSVAWFSESDNVPMGFELYRDDTLVALCKQPTYTFTGLSPNTSYQFSVKAYDQYYNQSPESLPLTITTAAADTFARDLMFVRYIEGSDYNKALEILNRTGHTVDLRHYYLRIRQYNEDADVLYWGSNQYQMEGLLQHGRSVVLVHPESNLSCLSSDSADFVSAGMPMTFEGWQAIDLRKDSFTVDRIGNPYEQVSFAADISLYRKEDILQPSLSFDTTEWTVFPVDYCVGLGQGTGTSVQERLRVPQAVLVYPNPVHGRRVYLQGKDLAGVNYAYLSTLQGKVIDQWEHPFLHRNYLELTQNIILPGLYFLHIEGQVFKLVLR